MLASMDIDGNIIVRDLRKSNDVISNFKVGCGSFESGFLMFNNKIKDEFFVGINSNMYIYHNEGTLIQQRDFDANIICGI